MTLHPLAGHLSVDASAARIRQYRWLEERIMRTLGGWIALTPELPVKLLFGRHVWDCAQHADLWGRRLPELRSPAQQGEPPSEGFVKLVDRIDRLQARSESIERLVSVYRVLKPHLLVAYASHLAGVNPVYEPPTRRILVRCLDEESRHVAAGTAILGRLPEAARARAEDCERHLLEELVRAGGIVAADASVFRHDEAPDLGGDLVALDSAFDPGVIDRELADALEVHRRALLSGDFEALAAQVSPGARDPVLELYRAAAPALDVAVVACARIGGYRFVKLALRGTRGLSILQLEWRPGAVGWSIVGGELIRSEPAS